jgi:hypothetical protein
MRCVASTSRADYIAARSRNLRGRGSEEKHCELHGLWGLTTVGLTDVVA